MNVYIVFVEGNTDYYSDIVSAHGNFDSAVRAKADAEQDAINDGHQVNGQEPNGADQAEWTRSFSVIAVPLED